MKKGRGKSELGQRGTGLERRRRWLFGAAAVVLAALIVCAVCMGTGVLRRSRQQHYELSPELRLTFSNADEIIAQMQKALARHDYRIYLKYYAQNGEMDDVPPLVEELMKYAMAETDDPTQGDYIRYQTGGYNLDWVHDEGDADWNYTLTITPVYYTKVAQEETVDQDVRDILADMHFMPWTSDYKKVRAIYDYVCQNVEYDAIHKSNQYHLKSTAYAALERGTAACQGYSVLFYRLLRECGISCRVVTGIGEYEGKTEFHAWNIVELDGQYYNVDTTWDSRLGSDLYFLRGESGFTGHTRDAEFETEEFEKAYPMAQEDYKTE